MIGNILADLFGEIGAFIVLLALFAIAFMFITEKQIMHHLKKKGLETYEKIKENANDDGTKEEYLPQSETVDKAEKRSSSGTGLAGHFFNFKKALQSDEEDFDPIEEEVQNDEISLSGDMKEITAQLTSEDGTESALESGEEQSLLAEEVQEEKDPFADLIINRGEAHQEVNSTPEQSEIAVEHLDREPQTVPIHQQELLNKFSNVEERAMTEIASETGSNLPQKSEDDFFMAMENNLKEYVDSDFTDDVFEIKKENDGEGVVMDGVDEENYQLPEEAIRQLQQPSAKQNVSPSDGFVSVDSPAGFVQIPTASAKPLNSPKPAPKKKKKYIFPTPELLDRPEKTADGISDESLKANAKKLQDTLQSFGVGARVVNVSCGPTVTRFELQPDQGVKVSKITALADDIKLNMAAEEIRIEAPIPGKAAVGIEIPNETNAMVHFRDLVENSKFKKHKSKISFAVGKDIGGQVVVSDIAKMPHLLIAGATGSGKSVCINTLIMSILYKADPEDVKLIMIDPKVVELSCYKGIPHLLIPVVTEPKKASAALQWAVMEMTERYNKFAELGVRDLVGYNERIKAVEYAQDERFQKLPQIVIIVDELADLMMVASKEVEDAICRLAQLARAAGIHLVIATQRPSVNVITGLIKANVPSRIAFAVSSAVDSRTILDGAGAEKLLGKGDMLFYPSGFPKPVRVQGAFVSDDEVNRVVSYIIEKNECEENQEAIQIEQSIMSVSTAGEGGRGADNSNDDYFIDAGKFIIEKNKASIGMLQRVYKIGFNRAARIMDQLCDAGVVGPEEGTKPRKVLMTMEEFENYLS
ncbi:MAG: DNA translocase FtsK [Lachnospiraceae bacterium]|nr:DNA translocase FtsK [Lachnospiraceae bacterium]